MSLPPALFVINQNKPKLIIYSETPVLEKIHHPFLFIMSNSLRDLTWKGSRPMDLEKFNQSTIAIIVSPYFYKSEMEKIHE